MTKWQYTGIYWIVYSNFLFTYFLKNQLIQRVIFNFMTVILAGEVLEAWQVLKFQIGYL